MKLTTLATVVSLAFSGSVQAECFMQAATLGKVAGKFDKVADAKKWVTSYSDNQKKCLVSFRGLAKGKWWDGTGEHIFETSVSDDAACEIALEKGKNIQLQQIFGKTVLAEEQMICSDMPKLQTKGAEIGDVVQLSELRPHPNKPTSFGYKGTECRYFIQPDVNKRNELYTWQGVVCNVRRGDWQVVDKW